MSTDGKILIDDIAEDFVIFLKEGEKMDFSSIFQEMDPSLKIINIEKLLRIHFVLTETDQEGNVGVIQFVQNLPDRLRRVKTTVKPKTEKYEGEVRGRIKWNETINLQNNCNSGIPSFICDRIERNYNITENIILKKVISIIYEIIEYDLKEAIEGQYSWLHEWIKEDKLKDVVSSLFFKNIYLKRITKDQDVITEQMITRAMKSRIPLYRDAAFLLLRYRKLLNFEFDSTEAKKILASTFIKPNKVETLFELYWIIKLIRHFKELTKDITFIPLEKGENCVAHWTINGRDYRIFHNSTANLILREGIYENAKALTNKNSFFGRRIRSIEALQELLETTGLDLWRGRPDIILEMRNRDQSLIKVLIGEVKYTNNRTYATIGLQELLEYMALSKQGDGYLEPFTELFQRHQFVIGCLFTDIIPDFTVKGNKIVKAIQFGEDQKLKMVLDELL